MDVIDEGAYGIVWKALNKETSQLGTLSTYNSRNKIIQRIR